MDPLLTRDGELVTGTVVDRPNRFVVRVRFDGSPARAHLADPGALEGVLAPGREIVCSPAAAPDRATDYDAVAVRADGVWVSLRTALANDLVERALARDALPPFAGYTCRAREPSLPDHGRTDFRLETPEGDGAYVEVKSTTHVADGVAMFPDRQTERGRRHVRALTALHDAGHEAHVLFVVQRPDATKFRPYRAVDPDFADLLARARAAGVGVHALATAFDPPHYRLAESTLPVDLALDRRG
jgi:sugar fermentation stimulation protein A